MAKSSFLKTKSQEVKTKKVVKASVLRSVNDTENQAYFAAARDASADEVCSASERSRLRAMSRKIQLDCANAANAARSLALSVYGYGPTLQVKTSNPDINKQIENLFAKWREQTGYDRLFFSAIQALPCDGEAFFHLQSNPHVLGGLSVELIEAYRIESPNGTSFSPDEFCGVRYDEYMRPLSYSVRDISANPTFIHANDWTEIPATQIEHLFIPLLVGQKRGLPLWQSAIQTLAALKKIEDSTLSAVETAANISFVVTSEFDPEGNAPDCGSEEAVTYSAFDTVKLPGRNNGLMLPSGMQATQFKPEQPGVNYNTFKQDSLLGVGAAIGEPKNIILNDSSSYNYSSARLDAQVFERWSGVLQRLCIPILNSHLRTFIASMAGNDEAVAELLTSYDLTDLPVKWFFQQPTHIDRVKEASADAMLFANNALTLRDFYARQGKDWREELEQIRREKEVLKELGLAKEEIL